MIHVLIGTKAQLIKMAPVMHSLEKIEVDYQFVLTGQHAETMDDLVEDFLLRSPDWSFVKPVEADTPFRLLVWLLKAFYGGYTGFRGSRGKHSIVLVHGDTLSTLLAAVLGRLSGFRVMHIEAGLRSFSYLNPFPEELVRVLVTRLSSHFVCQDERAVQNLTAIGVDGSRILNTGANTLFDSLVYVKRKQQLSRENDNPYCVVSLHRSENLGSDKRFNFLMSQVKRISMTVPVMFVLHPVTRKKLKMSGWDREFENTASISLLERMSYSEFIALLAGAKFLVTDGGSNQEEAYYLGLPCLLMRQATERQEGLGLNAVVSNYDEAVIEDFLSNIETRRSGLTQLAGESPSDQIARYISELEKT